jgi:hypothetical protein
MKTLLMVAFHFPPAAMGSGHLRTLGFARHLPALGWTPVVLSASANAYPRVDPTGLAMVPPGCCVHRAFALDTRRHLGLRGKYPSFLAVPDRWATWWFAAVWRGLRLARDIRVDAIWSTYPVMTAHAIANTLSKRTGLPWIADFRDPVATSVSAINARARRAQKQLERHVVRHAARTVLTTPSAMHDYAERYPDAAREHRLAVIPNGYEESAFLGLTPDMAGRSRAAPLRLVHAGSLYADGRDPVPFMTALTHLKDSGVISTDSIRVVLRASGFDAIYRHHIARLGLTGIVSMAPQIPNPEALREQAEADGLLLFQGACFNHQIPAKVYDYLRVGRPIFALLDERGDTAALLRRTGGAMLAPIEDVESIQDRLTQFLRLLRSRNTLKRNAEVIRGLSRAEGARQLVGLLDRAVEEQRRG